MGKKQKLMVLCSVVLFMTSIAGADTYTMIFNTSDNQFDPGVDNQGWWSATASNETIADNYGVGMSHSGEHNNFFSFDISSINQIVISAKLELRRFNYHSSANSEIYGLFDVSTDAATLNNKNGINEDIYDDLGTGINYGEFEVFSNGLSTDVLCFELNEAAISDINSASTGWFSIGGSLLSLGSPTHEGVEVLFGGSHEDEGIQRLVVEVVPEPASFIMFFVCGCALLKKRKIQY